MELKVAKNQSKKVQKLKSVRIGDETEKKLEKILAAANKKKLGRKIKVDQVVGLALELLTEDHIKKLQNQSLSNEDRKENLPQKWSQLHGPVSKETFTGVMMKPEFFEFLKEHCTAANVI